MAATDPELLIPDTEAWRAWLDEHEASSNGVWLVLARKGKDAPTSLTRDAALEEALCSGWIDAQALGRDDATSLQRYCPRRARSRWSARNVRIAERLVAEGRMRPRGQQEIDRARADGRWESAYEVNKNFEVPPDLAEALAASPRASEMFEILTAQNRFAILFRVTGVKRPETRARNIAKFVAMLERGETVHPQKRRLEA
ncbi:YdeI family protein [Promicromonospora sp. NPDC050880]|uniref:YdeI family protein n=1 Tax=Promicromonospora sp. NPDC050880 TaxID=3364406 RepID=UPI0037A51967